MQRPAPLPSVTSPTAAAPAQVASKSNPISRTNDLSTNQPSSLANSQPSASTRQTSSASVSRGNKSPQAFIQGVISQFNRAIRISLPEGSDKSEEVQDQNPLVVSLQKLIIQLSKSNCKLVATDLIKLTLTVLEEFAAPTQFTGALLPSKKDASASIDDVREDSPQFWVLETLHLVFVANMQSTTMSEVFGTPELAPMLVQLQELCFDRMSPGCSAAVRTEAAQCLGALSGISVSTVGEVLTRKLEAAVGIRVEGIGKALGKLGLGNTKDDDRNVAERRAASYMRALRLIDFHFKFDANSDPPNQQVSFQDSVLFLVKFVGLLDQVERGVLRNEISSSLKEVFECLSGELQFTASGSGGQISAALGDALTALYAVLMRWTKVAKHRRCAVSCLVHVVACCKFDSFLEWIRPLMLLLVEDVKSKDKDEDYGFISQMALKDINTLVNTVPVSFWQGTIGEEVVGSVINALVGKGCASWSGSSFEEWDLLKSCIESVVKLHVNAAQRHVIEAVLHKSVGSHSSITKAAVLTSFSLILQLGTCTHDDIVPVVAPTLVNFKEKLNAVNSGKVLDLGDRKMLASCLRVIGCLADKGFVDELPVSELMGCAHSILALGDNACFSELATALSAVAMSKPTLLAERVVQFWIDQISGALDCDSTIPLFNALAVFIYRMKNNEGASNPARAISVPLWRKFIVKIEAVVISWWCCSRAWFRVFLRSFVSLLFGSRLSLDPSIFLHSHLPPAPSAGPEAGADFFKALSNHSIQETAMTAATLFLPNIWSQRFDRYLTSEVSWLVNMTQAVSTCVSHDDNSSPETVGSSWIKMFWKHTSNVPPAILLQNRQLFDAFVELPTELGSHILRLCFQSIKSFNSAMKLTTASFFKKFKTLDGGIIDIKVATQAFELICQIASETSPPTVDSDNVAFSIAQINLHLFSAILKLCFQCITQLEEVSTFTNILNKRKDHILAFLSDHASIGASDISYACGECCVSLLSIVQLDGGASCEKAERVINSLVRSGPQGKHMASNAFRAFLMSCPQLLVKYMTQSMIKSPKDTGISASMLYLEAIAAQVEQKGVESADFFVSRLLTTALVHLGTGIRKHFVVASKLLDILFTSMLQDVETPSVSMMSSRITITSFALRISTHTCQHFQKYSFRVWEYIEELLPLVCPAMKESIARSMQPWFVAAFASVPATGMFAFMSRLLLNVSLPLFRGATDESHMFNWPHVLECWRAVLDMSADREATIRFITETLLGFYGSSEDLDLCIRALFSEFCFSLEDAAPCYSLLRQEFTSNVSLPSSDSLASFMSWTVPAPVPVSQRTEACAIVIADTMEMNPSLLSDNWSDLLSFAFVAERCISGSTSWLPLVRQLRKVMDAENKTLHEMCTAISHKVLHEVHVSFLRILASSFEDIFHLSQLHALKYAAQTMPLDSESWAREWTYVAVLLMKVNTDLIGEWLRQLQAHIASNALAPSSLIHVVPALLTIVAHEISHEAKDIPGSIRRTLVDIKPLVIDVTAQVSRRLSQQHHDALNRIIFNNSIQSRAIFSFFARCLWIAPSFSSSLTCIAELLQQLPDCDTRQSLLCGSWIAIGAAVLCREPGVLAQLREMVRPTQLPQRHGTAPDSSSWVVVQALQDFITQDESESQTAASISAAAPAASAVAIAVASPMQGSGNRRASSIALAGLTASPSSVNQSIKRRLSVAQMSSLSSSGAGGSGAKVGDTFEMRRIWRFCDSMIAAFGEDAVVDSFL